MKTLRIAVIQKLIKTSETLVKQASYVRDQGLRESKLNEASGTEFRANCIAIKYGLTDYLTAAREVYYE